jgi:hypothetical protein
MARSQQELHEILKGITGVAAAYIQPPSTLKYPCILQERSSSWVLHADNKKFFKMRRYTVTVFDRDPDSSIPDLVEDLPHTRFDRFFVNEGINHWVFTIYF